MTIRAHFDGKTIVPDEPIDLPPNTALNVHLEPVAIVDAPSLVPPPPSDVAERKRRMSDLRASIPGVTLPAHISRAENFYDERE